MRQHKRTGTINAEGYRVFFIKGRGYIYEHHIVAERALGKPLPRGAEIHHVDENKANNVGANLVICPGRAYHLILHQRTRAFDACGNANWRKCNVCKRYDDPVRMYVHKKNSWHRECANERQRRMKNAP